MGLLSDIFTASFRGESSPQLPHWIEWKHISKGRTHCPTCLRLDGCWFKEDNKPKLPHHAFCHCTAFPLPLSQVLNNTTSQCDIRKFSEYIFNPKYDANGKRALYEGWGYSIRDSETLKKAFEEKALEKYMDGQYVLGRLNEQGQRISITIELERKDRPGTVQIITGWMVYPDGHIRLTTPLGG